MYLYMTFYLRNHFMSITKPLFLPCQMTNTSCACAHGSSGVLLNVLSTLACSGTDVITLRLLQCVFASNSPGYWLLSRKVYKMSVVTFSITDKIYTFYGHMLSQHI